MSNGHGPIEEAAKAIYEAAQSTPRRTPWRNLDEAVQAVYREQARAVLDVLQGWRGNGEDQLLTDVFETILARYALDNLDPYRQREARRDAIPSLIMAARRILVWRDEAAVTPTGEVFYAPAGHDPLKHHEEG